MCTSMGSFFLIFVIEFVTIKINICKNYNDLNRETKYISLIKTLIPYSCIYFIILTEHIFFNRSMIF
jgi:hypothetical protein